MMKAVLYHSVHKWWVLAKLVTNIIGIKSCSVLHNSITSCTRKWLSAAIVFEKTQLVASVTCLCHYTIKSPSIITTYGTAHF